MSENENPPDERGVHKFRFKWRELITQPPKNVKHLVMKWDLEENTAKFYFEKQYEGYEEAAVSLDEIVNIKILEKISKIQSEYSLTVMESSALIVPSSTCHAYFELPAKSSTVSPLSEKLLPANTLEVP